MCVVAISTYLSSLWEVAALPAIIEVDVKQEFAIASTAVTSRTRFLPTCQRIKDKPSGRLPSIWKRPTGFLGKQSWL